MVVGVYFIAAVSIPDTPAAIEKGEERERKGNTQTQAQQEKGNLLSTSIFARIFFGFISSSCFLIWTVSPETVQPLPLANSISTASVKINTKYIDRNKTLSS